MAQEQREQCPSCSGSGKGPPQGMIAQGWENDGWTTVPRQRGSYYQVEIDCQKCRGRGYIVVRTAAEVERDEKAAKKKARDEADKSTRAAAKRRPVVQGATATKKKPWSTRMALLGAIAAGLTYYYTVGQKVTGNDLPVMTGTAVVMGFMIAGRFYTWLIAAALVGGAIYLLQRTGS